MRTRRDLQSPDDYVDSVMDYARSEFKEVERRGAEFILRNDEEIVLSQRFPSSMEGRFVKLSFAFRGVRTTHGLAKLMDIATKESVTCDFSIAARGVANTDQLRRVCRSSAREFSETADGNFRAKLTLHGVSLEVDAYARTGNVSIRGTHNRFLGDIGKAIDSLLAG